MYHLLTSKKRALFSPESARSTLNESQEKNELSIMLLDAFMKNKKGTLKDKLAEDNPASSSSSEDEADEWVLLGENECAASRELEKIMLLRWASIDTCKY